MGFNSGFKGLTLPLAVMFLEPERGNSNMNFF